MKKIIISLNDEIPRNLIDDFVNKAIENGITDYIVNSPFLNTKLSSIEHVNIYSEKAEFNPQFLILNHSLDDHINHSLIESSKKSNFLVGIHTTLMNKDSETKIIQLAKTYTDIAFIIVELVSNDWKVLPFENLIAELLSVDILLFAKVHNLQDSDLMTKLLEVGVDGIVFTPSSTDDIAILSRLMRDLTKFTLHEAEVIDMKPISKADRVCVDTTSILNSNEGMLIGSTANGFALVQAEVTESMFSSSRPFRVNAGDVSAYILVPSFDEKGELQVKTRYLSEIKAGDDVLISDIEGNLRIVTVGRAKIETRPMILLNLSIHTESQEIPMNIILQNAESVNLLTSDGKPISVLKIKRGDRILCYIGPGATHFGTPIKEKIIEK